jgi:hypothetical protein
MKVRTELLKLRVAEIWLMPTVDYFLHVGVEQVTQVSLTARASNPLA